MDPVTAVINGIAPRQLIALGATVNVVASGKDPFIVKRCMAGHYTCSCLAFQGASGPVNARSCSHLKKTLGDQYEEARMRLSGRPGGADAAATRLIMRKRQREPCDYNLLTEQQKAAGSRWKKQGEVQGIEIDRDGRQTFNGRPLPKNFDPKSAVGMMQSEPWDKDLDPKGWWMSEKLDGVRAYWTGEKLISRANRDWQPPQSFLDRLPKGFALDGELWRRRDSFEGLAGICSRTDIRGWDTVNFFVFDAPGLNLPFEERLKAAKKMVPDGEMAPDDARDGNFGGRIATLRHVICEGQEHLDDFMKAVLDDGGEGAMLRRRNSPYERRRSTHSRKVKVWDDGEGVVVGFNKDQRSGRVESINLRMKSGIIFDVGVGMTDIMHAGQNLPEKGRIVKYRCQGLTMEDIPRFPIYEGVCLDRFEATDPKVATTQLRKRRREEFEASQEAMSLHVADLEDLLEAEGLSMGDGGLPTMMTRVVAGRVAAKV